jgi:hypothetical protein
MKTLKYQRLRVASLTGQTRKGSVKLLAIFVIYASLFGLGGCEIAKRCIVNENGDLGRCRRECAQIKGQLI